MLWGDEKFWLLDPKLAGLWLFISERMAWWGLLSSDCLMKLFCWLVEKDLCSELSNFGACWFTPDYLDSLMLLDP
jgi:hypothetical protein